MTPTATATHDTLAAGRAALAAGDWSHARACLERRVAERPEDAAAWEGLSWAGWWLHDGALTIAAREEAYRAYREAGDAIGAGRMAFWAASDHRETRGDAAVGQGWLGRAHTLLDPLPACAEHGWLALHEGAFALGAGAAAVAAEWGGRAAALGRRLAVADLEAIGLAQLGRALVLQGRVDEGMARLGEASVIAQGERLAEPISQAWALCYLVSACEGVGDFPRAIAWCDAMRAIAERWRGRQILGECRTAYGRILATRGQWPAADDELRRAVDDIDASRPGLSGTAYVRLAELRARQGRADEARELFARAGAHPEALVGHGALALTEGDAIVARDAAERVLRRLPQTGTLSRLPALELQARALIALGELDAAAEPCVEARTIADTVATAYLAARAHHLAAELALARGDLDGARRAGEDAVDAFTTASAPYAAASARLTLSAALVALERCEHAAAEAHVARQTFRTLGAADDAGRAETLLAQATSGACAGTPVPAPAPVDDEAAPAHLPSFLAVVAAATRTWGTALGPPRSAAARRPVTVAVAPPAAAAASPRAVAAPPRATAASDPTPEPHAPDTLAADLTAREREILRLVANGLSDAEIAVTLVVSPHTVHRHVANIRGKLRLPSRAAAVAYATRAGVL